MEVKKKVEIVIETTNGKKVNEGDVVMFSCGGRCLFGEYKGIDTRGNWKFKGIHQFEDVNFSVAPRSIVEMFHIADVVDEYEDIFPMNPPEECED